MSATPELERFAEALERDAALDQLALLVGQWDHPDADVAAYRQRLDEIAELARPRVEAPQSSLQRALTIADVLFAELRFRGNVEDYYDPRNSFLAQVLDRRLGIPITLSVLFLEIARRVGVIAQGVSFPGHFLVRVADDDRWRVLDPFASGRLLSPADLEELLRRSAGPDAVLQPSLLAPATKRQIVTRILVNLAGIYGRNGDLPRSLVVLERLALLDPDNSRLARELANLQRSVDSLN
ncbi:MAG: transglutaminase-like domain-containing protein [Kofleriaceae bacterium]